jgi:hypothetical protein
MKLPSGREISIDSLADAAEMLAEESFYLGGFSEAEKIVMENLGDRCFELSGTEAPFGDDDIKAILDTVRPVAADVGGELAKMLEGARPLIKSRLESKLTLDSKVKHKLLIHLQTLSVAAHCLSELYEKYPELNDQVDISYIVPTLDVWWVEIDKKIDEVERREVADEKA